MPTEGFEEGKLYFEDENGELKELGITKDVEPKFEKDEELKQLIKDLENNETYELKLKINKYSKKRFKKLLMSKGIQRNEARIYSYLAGKRNIRDDYGIATILLGIF